MDLKPDFKKEIIKDIQSLSSDKAPYDIFRDWIECMAIAIANGVTYHHDDLWQKREEQYLKIIDSYKDKGEGFCRMYDFLLKALQEEIKDVLGEVYMESGCGNKNTGQFFTPFHVSRMAAGLALEGKDLSKPFSMHKPSCGAGGTIFAMAAELMDRGINYQKSTIEQMTRRIAKRAGVERANPHKFRRTCATMALRHGMPIEQVSKMLGHEDLSTTQIYLDLTEEDLAQAHKKYVI